LPDTTGLLSHWYIKIDGQDVPTPFMHAVASATVESSLHLPDVATITLHDPGATFVDAANVAPGKTVEIRAQTGNTQHKLFDGEIVELEADFVSGDRRVVVRAFDRLHRLARIRKVRTFVNATDCDMASTLAGEVGLQAETGNVSIVHPYAIQDNVSNLDFLRERAAMVGYLLWVDGTKLHFDEHGHKSASITLEFARDLSEFHPRLTTVDQVTSVSVSGWDPKEAKPITGKAETANGVPKLDKQVNGGALAKQAFGFESTVLVADRPVHDQTFAEKIAQGALDRRAGRFIEAEGLTHGHPQIVAGVELELTGLGTRFSGKYFVTGATHSYGGTQGYVTRFTVSGFDAPTLLSLLGSDREALTPGRVGLVIGLVTDNDDPDGLGRVKVKFPWLSDKDASDWARVIMPGGGPERGLEFLPEVNDEVLVGFEHGNMNYPFVLGGLWNGQLKPPISSKTLVKSGKVEQRVIRSRTGHIITLDDSDNAPYIEIVDNTKKNTIKLDSKNNKLTVHLEGDMLFEANSGEIQLKAQKVTVTATDALKMKGNTVDAEADTTVNVKASTDLTLKGMSAAMSGDTSISLKGGTTAELKGSASLTLDGGASTAVKGAIVTVG
jgi:phage protein D